jgi:hypothetical protein
MRSAAGFLTLGDRRCYMQGNDKGKRTGAGALNRPLSEKKTRIP